MKERWEMDIMATQVEKVRYVTAKYRLKPYNSLFDITSCLEKEYGDKLDNYWLGTTKKVQDTVQLIKNIGIWRYK